MNLTNKLFDYYVKKIIAYNHIHMLTGFKTKELIYERLFKDSLLAFTNINLRNKKILDIGTGAGIPGIPLKINEPSLALTLLETQNKRVKFLKTLKKIQFNLIVGRAEDVYQKYIEYFDIVTMRAVAPININLEIAAQFIKKNGFLVLIKGPKFMTEIALAKITARKLGFKHVSNYQYKISNNIQSITVLYQKIKKTPNCYPRIYAQIKKQPL